MSDREPIVLASASPRRAEILDTLGIPFVTRPARIDESVHEGESPRGHVERLARAKAAAVAGLVAGRRVLAGDTIVVLGERILGKPRDADAAVDMLMQLQGGEHRVLSALALADGSGGGTGTGARIRSGVQETRVRFREFDPATARAYVDTGEPMDKAGAYGIQGLGAVLVKAIEGDYTGVVGLPVPLLVRLLAEAGVGYRFPSRG